MTLDRTSPARPMRSQPGLVAAIALLFGIAAGVPTAWAQAKKTTSFSELGAYVLELDGKRADAKIYHSPGYGTILVEITELGKLVELDPRVRSVNAYVPEHFSTNPDGTRDRLSVARPEATSRFEIVGQLPAFVVDGHSAKLILKPPMLGQFDRARLLSENPGYLARSLTYKPYEVHLERLRAIEDPIVVRVFFGSWCSVCFEMLPHVVKLEAVLEGSAIHFEYYGLPQGFDEPEAKRLKVESVPTAIIYRSGEEVSRLKGYSFRIPEMSLANTLQGVTAPVPTRSPPGN